MTIVDEGRHLRTEIAKLRPDRRRRYPEGLRARIVDWVRRASAAGMSECDSGKVLGIRTWRFRSWRSEQEPSVAEPLALIPVETPPFMVGSGPVLVTPSGCRVEGLTVEQIGALLRDLL
jgi:hypothetical protein